MPRRILCQEKLGFILEIFRGLVLPVGKIKSAYIRSEAINETTNPAKYISDSDFRGMVLALTELDNLLKSNDYIGWEKDDGSHPDVLRWIKYRTRFLVHDEIGKPQVLQGEVKIKRIAQGDCFYDITQIKNITDSDIGQNIVNYAAKSIGDVSDPTIAQQSLGVNTQSTQSAAKNSLAGESFESLKRQAQEKVA